MVETRQESHKKTKQQMRGRQRKGVRIANAKRLKGKRRLEIAHSNQARALTLLSRVSSGKILQTPQGHRNSLDCPVACFCSRRKVEPRRLSQKKGEAMMCCSAAAAAAAAADDDDDDDADEVFRTQLRG